jgi:hypothetical protein
MFVHNIIRLSDWFDTISEELKLTVIDSNPHMFWKMKNPSKKIQIAITENKMPEQLFPRKD